MEKWVKKGHFVKAEDGEIFRLVRASLKGVDETIVEKVTRRLTEEGVEAGSAVRISKAGAEGIFIHPDDPAGFDKDKDSP